MVRDRKLIDKIETVRANSVTDKEFREYWGESTKEAVKDMMEFVRDVDAEMESKVCDKLKEWAASKKGKAAALKIARERQKKLKTLAEMLGKAAKMRRYGHMNMENLKDLRQMKAGTVKIVSDGEMMMVARAGEDLPSQKVAKGKPVLATDSGRE